MQYCTVQNSDLFNDNMWRGEEYSNGGDDGEGGEGDQTEPGLRAVTVNILTSHTPSCNLMITKRSPNASPFISPTQLYYIYIKHR